MRCKTCQLTTSLLLLFVVSFSMHSAHRSSGIISYTINPSKQALELFWKDDRGRTVGNLQQLSTMLQSKHQKLVFAMNGGMYKEDQSPLGLFIQHQKLITPLNTSTGYGNFYMKPNGVFYIMKNDTTGICRTEDLPSIQKIKFATQSGPMLVIDGKINAAFREGSPNLNIRNGVGLMADNTLLFAISTTPVNFHKFASFFQSNGCQQALYLDGFVSRIWLPEKNLMQPDGNLGVLIGSYIPE
ncbi:MAG: phosphodiester glycosidase family protein [Chitinophagaceae bacterium]|nr:phosphodiester glycosidase family protein [Chitinophagaceae bacterium]